MKITLEIADSLIPYLEKLADGRTLEEHGKIILEKSLLREYKNQAIARIENAGLESLDKYALAIETADAVPVVVEPVEPVVTE